MTPTKLQKKIIDACIYEMQCWKDSDDIHSSKHNYDGKVSLCDAYFELDVDDGGFLEINFSLQNLRRTILNVTEKYENNRTD